MDPQQQQKLRLQAYNSSSPSLRVAAAPSFSGPLQVGVAHPGNLYLADNQGNPIGPPIQADPNAVAGGPNAQDPVATKALQQDGENPYAHAADFIGNTVGSAVRFVPQFAENYANTFANIGNKLAGGQDQTIQQNLGGNAPLNAVLKFSQATGKTKQLAGDVGQIAAAALSPAPEVSDLGLLGKSAVSAGIGAAAGASNTLASPQPQSAGNYLKNTAIGGTIGGLIPGLGAAFSKVKSAITGNPASVGLTKDTLNFIKKSSDPEQIHALLSSVYGDTSDALQNASQAIAGSNNSKFIINELARLPEQGGAAIAAGAIAGDEAARAKYGESPLTGQSAPATEIVSPPSPETRELETNPGAGTPAEGAAGVQLNAAELPDKYKAAIEAAGGTVPSKPNPALAEAGLTKGKVTTTPISDLKLGPNTDPTELPDVNQVSKYVQDIKDGKPIEPIITSKDENGNTIVEDGKHRLAALKAMGETNAPTIEAGSGAAEAATAPTSAAVQEVSPAAQVAASEATPSPTDLPTGFGEKQNALKRATLSVNGELDQYGEGGKAISAGNKEAVATAEKGQAFIMKQIPAVLSLKKSEFEDFVNTLKTLSKGENPGALSPNVKQAIEEWTTVTPQIRAHATSVGLEVGDRGQHYFPQTYSELLSTKDGISRAINHLVDSGQAANTVEARQMLQYAHNPLTEQFGSLEKSRQFDMPGYDKSKNALVNYLTGAYKRIGQAEQFGAKGEKAASMIDQATREGFDGQRVDELYKVANGLDRTNTGIVEKASQKLQSFNRLKSLGLSAITNATQTVNDITKGGLLRSVKAYAQQLSPEERDFVHETGVVSNGALHDLREGTGIGNKLTGKLTAPGFNKIETFNRTHSALTGKLMGDDLASQGSLKAVTSLRKLGVTGDIGETLTREQQIQAARGFVGATQFRVSPQDLPRWADTSAGRLVAQFRTFSYKQTKFIYEEVLKEASQGNILPLIRYTAAGAAAGYAAAQTKGLLTNTIWSSIKGNQQQTKNTPQSDVAKFVDALNVGGGIGLGNDAAFLAQNRKSVNFPQYIAGTVGGPTAGLAVQTSTNLQRAFAGSPTSLERQALQTIPVAGKTIAGFATPFSDQTSNNAPVTDYNGKPVLDAKGKPVTVTVPKGAGPAEIQDLVDAKRVSAVKAAYIRSLPQALQIKIGLPDSQLQAEIKDGTITQSDYDHIKNVQKTADSVSKGNQYAVPAGVTTPEATQFFQHWNSMDAKDQKAYLNQPADQNAKDIATKLSAQKLTGLPDFTPSNKLSQLYSNYEKDINTHSTGPNAYTAIDLRNKAKSLQLAATKLNYNQDTTDIFAEGGSNDLKTLLAAGSIQKPDMDAAIQLDNQLYTSGLESSLKFSKTFRNAYGYQTPTNGAASDSSGSGDSTTKGRYAGVVDYQAPGTAAEGLSTLLSPIVPSATTGAMPKFSAAARQSPVSTIKFNAPPNVIPTKGSTRVLATPFRTAYLRTLRNSVGN